MGNSGLSISQVYKHLRLDMPTFHQLATKKLGLYIGVLLALADPFVTRRARVEILMSDRLLMQHLARQVA